MRQSESYRLSDRYEREDGKVFMSGLQALARVPVDQLRADQRLGHNTSAFVSGYPGSPLGGFDGAIDLAIAHADDVSIVHTPALNEEYAATAVMGSQLVTAQPDCLVDGVVGIWYGKAPGLDRASDAIRIGMAAGTDRLGGAVAFVGDDPAAKSSTIPSSRAGVLADMHLPVLFPSNPSEILDLGRHAIGMSRATGLWVGVKVVSDVADGTGTVDLEPDRVVPIVPTIDGEPYTARPNSRLLAAEGVEAERDIFEVRDELARIYGAENHLNQVVVDPTDAWIGIVAPGSTYRETRQALRKLGLDDDHAVRAAGIRLLHLRMTSPLDRTLLRRFATGLDEVLVVEDKDPNVENRMKAVMYGMADAPVIVGKRDEHERALLPGHGTLLADTIEPALRRRLERRLATQLEPRETVREKNLIPLSLERTPFFCSGCPHNSSTVVPDGSLVGSGIGCHTMVLLLDEDRVGDIVGITAMGNEGAQWLGMADFLGRRHFIHNVGDGTYFHSGQLAIQAAVAAGVSMTFKILYNGALAMTGGQSAQGQRSVPDLAAQLKAVGVERVLITADDVGRYRGVDLPRGVDVWDRSRVLEAQEELASIEGVTVLIHDQDCAAELRRERKRGRKPTPNTRVVINHRICEGCGDCGEKSNCLSVQPLETEWGRKTTIDQSSCNIDLSCLEGDCPSFMTVTTREPDPASRGLPVDPEPMPDPVLVVPQDDFGVHIAGIGGTGVVTVSQTLGTAAMFDGYEVAGLDQTGLSQKAGPVVSDVRLRRTGSIQSNRVGDGQADLLLAFDQLVAASPRGLSAADPARTTVVGSTSLMPTGAMIARPDMDTPNSAELAARIEAASRSDHQYWADAAARTTEHLGHAIYANVFVVGMAVQAGCLPITAQSIERALRLNDVDVENNIAAFRWGRRAVLAADEFVESTESLSELVERLRCDLVAFQDDSCAREFVEFVDAVGAAETRVSPGSTGLTRAVAVNLHKLTAYKDEYEVARLMLDADGRRAAEEVKGGGGRVAWRLHPPVLRAMGMRRKITVGQWAEPAVRVLARGKRLRGTALDPFGRASVRVLERELAPEYRRAIRTVLAGLSAENLEAAIELAELPDIVRGYEELKLARAREYRSRLAAALAEFEAD